MGYWEQIGVENMRHRERRAKMNPIRRKVQDFLVNLGIWAFAIFYWIVMLAPVTIPLIKSVLK